jgi:hypothetical protein
MVIEMKDHFLPTEPGGVNETVAGQQVETRAAQVDWNRVSKNNHPPQQWFEDTDNPFEAEGEFKSYQ